MAIRMSRSLNSNTFTSRRDVLRNTGADTDRGIRFDVVGIIVSDGSREGFECTEQRGTNRVHRRHQRDDISNACGWGGASRAPTTLLAPPT